jgi:hypothetical protein
MGPTDGESLRQQPAARNLPRFFRAALRTMRNFRCFSHSPAIVRTGLQTGVESHKMLEIKGFSAVNSTLLLTGLL